MGVDKGVRGARCVLASCRDPVNVFYTPQVQTINDMFVEARDEIEYAKEEAEVRE